MVDWGHSRAHEFRTVSRPAGCYTLAEAAARNEFSPTTLRDRVDAVCFRRDKGTLSDEDILLLSSIVQDKDGILYFERKGFDAWSASYMAREDVQSARARRVVVAPSRREQPLVLRSERQAATAFMIHSRNGEWPVWFNRPLD